MSSLGAFQAGTSMEIVLSTASLSVASAVALPPCGDAVLIVNNCGQIVKILFDVTAPTVTATAWTYAAPAGKSIVSVARDTALFVSAMPIGTASGSVYFIRGTGSFF